MNDPDEVKVYCAECSGYLWSVSRCERDPDDNLVPCPMQKDPMGGCTGTPKRK